MKFRFLIYATSDRDVYAGFHGLLNAERYAEEVSKSWSGKVLVLDSQRRQVLLAAKSGKVDFAPQDRYPF
jgi:hypothetical protein